ncbi:MAG: diguanylate cyclase [Desulfuromonas sp.]|nr:MAG: diguanylate cyclase [Desulfuromonas sp.]
MVASAVRHQRIGVLLYLGVHHFKRINDTLGLELGDCLLQEIALRLRRFVRECDVLGRNPFDEGRVSRLGGDEFCILLSEIARVDDAAQVVQRLDQVMNEPFLLGEQQLHVTLRTGISVFPADSEEPETLLKQAYTALSHAKDTSGAYQFYEHSMTEEAVSRMLLEQEIRIGIERKDFKLFYQPLVDLESGAVIGVEALARWQHPQRGLVSPAEFIPVAEESGLIVPLGRDLLLEACLQGAAWQAQGYPPLRISVNISPRQFVDDDVCALLGGVLARSGLPPENLEVEITESLLLDDASQADATLMRIKEMGIGVAIDDFGTGYSSLSYLHAFPIDTLKIDRSFVNNGTAGGQAEAILKAIVAMGQSLEMNILAEGIETDEQRRLLGGLGCHQAQGYLFGRPLPLEEIEELFACQFQQGRGASG